MSDKDKRVTRQGSRSDENRPSLQIIQQPQEKIRFRYKTEIQVKNEPKRAVLSEQTRYGTQHGCLKGSDPNNRTEIKGYPTVQLLNYSGKAMIRCELVQHDNTDEHPYKLKKGTDDHRPHHVVPERGSYTARFSGMAIMYVTRKEMSEWMENKIRATYGSDISEEELNALRGTMESNICVNKARLKFSAHDVDSDEQLCEAVFSETISNSRTVETNDLKIVKMSVCRGSSIGGTNILMFVSKVNKKDIEILFIQESDKGETIWSAKAAFVPSDVHYQYGIAFRTPQYAHPRTDRDVRVSIRLRRPSDGATSEPVEFHYTADPFSKMSKKRKYPNGFSDLFNNELAINETAPQQEQPLPLNEAPQQNLMQTELSEPVQLTEPTNEVVTDSSISLGIAEADPRISESFNPLIKSNPMWSQNYLGGDIHSRTAQPEPSYLNDDDYMSSLNEKFDLAGFENLLVSDSGRGKGSLSDASSSRLDNNAKLDAGSVKQEPSDYSACFTPEEGAQVRKLIKELCDVVRNKNERTKQDVRNIMEPLFEIRLSNGDTFLHMALQNDITSFEYIVKLLHSVQMQFVLNLANDMEQTILHLAVAKNMTHTIALLVSKGSNPMLKDHEGNNAVHYAVRSSTCMNPLLNAIKKNDVALDLNDCNNDKQTPLHLAAIYNCAASARALLQHGASYSVRDTHGRTPLHLAAYDDKLLCARALLDFIAPEDIDVVDGNGNTALQIVSGVTMRQNTREFIELLLEKKADPSKHEAYNEPAWSLVRNKPEICEIFNNFSHTASDDDYASADEFDDR